MKNVFSTGFMKLDQGSISKNQNAKICASKRQNIYPAWIAHLVAHQLGTLRSWMVWGSKPALDELFSESKPKVRKAGVDAVHESCPQKVYMFSNRIKLP